MSRFPALEPPPYDNPEHEPLPEEDEWADEWEDGEDEPEAPLPHTSCIQHIGHYIQGTSWQVAGNGAKTSENCGKIDHWLYCKCCPPRPIKAHCDKPSCPECYEIWGLREASRSAERIVSVMEQWGMRRKRMLASHYTLSIPSSYYELFKTELGYRQIRKDAIKLLKRAGLVGGVLVVHAHRKNKQGENILSPHFHILGAGFIQSATAWEKGWFLKKIGRMDAPSAIMATAKYILSHAGILQADGRRTVNTVSWFGLFSTALVRVKIIRTLEKMHCENGGLFYHDAACEHEVWRIVRCYSYRLKPNPPPKYLSLLPHVKLRGVA